MAQLKVTTKERVNVRKGAGISFERVGTIKAWQTLTVEGVEQDVSGINWYKIKEGYICSKWCEVGIAHEMKAFKDDDTGPDASGPTPMSKDTAESVTTNINSTINSMLGGVGQGLGSTLDSFLSGFMTQESQEVWYRRRIFGHPFQFTAQTDIRPSRGVNLGRIYTSHILTEAPIFSIMPCKPNYLPSLSTEEKKNIMVSLTEQLSEASTDLMKSAGQAVTDLITETKYFTTSINHVEYMKYVNLLCRAAALFMGIGNQTVPGTMAKYREYDWTNWRMSNSFGNESRAGGEVVNSTNEDGSFFESIARRGEQAVEEITGAVGDALSPVAGIGSALANGEEVDPDLLAQISTEQYYVDFYVTPSSSYSESISNRTEQSMFEGLINKGSDLLKEIGFVTGSATANSDAIAKSLEAFSASTKETMERMAGKGETLMSRLLGDAKTIISGSNIIFPEIYHDSERSQSYRIEIKLVSPYGSKEAIFLTILVPLFHILAFALPRQTTVNSYGSPFLIKAHIDKWFSCEMGMVDSLEITKDDWAANGFPTQITVSVSIKDLYSMLAMSKYDDPQNAYRFALNQSLIEYLSVLCGLEMKKSEWKKKFEMIRALNDNMVQDYVSNKAGEIRQGAANAAGQILGGLGAGRT